MRSFVPSSRPVTGLRTYFPAAVAGSILLSLAPSPAHAATHSQALAAPPQPHERVAPATVAPAAVPAKKDAPAVPDSHTVRAGDTVGGIAHKYGLRTADVLAANGLTYASIIYPGEKLTLTVGTAASTPAAKKPTAAAASSGSGSSYTVKSGDTVWDIARRSGVSVGALQAANGLDRHSVIHPGQKLTIPGGAAASSQGSAASSSPAKPTAAAPKPAAAAGSYTVRSGDTLWGIANSEGVSLAALLTANGLSTRSIIYPGQKVSIPGAGGSNAAAAKPAAQAPTAAKPAAAAKSAGSYTIRSGDTLWKIATSNKVSLGALMRANNLAQGVIIYPGQKLTIPSSGSVASVKATDIPTPKSSSATSAAAAKITNLDAEQAGNARLIIKIGRELGVSDFGIMIALGTAMQESSLRNLHWGDRDSQGLFQQRPSQGWGTVKQVTDKARSIRVFYGGPADPNGKKTDGLLDIKGWQKMSFTQAAQSVQISAFPDAYAKWQASAKAWLKAHG